MKPLNILTTAQPIGVVTRDVIVIVGAVLTVLGALGLLTEEQVKTLTEQAPILMTSLGTILTIGMAAYRAITKSHSDKADEAAKEIDAKIPKADPVEIKTPGSGPDIRIAGEK